MSLPAGPLPVVDHEYWGLEARVRFSQLVGALDADATVHVDVLLDGWTGLLSGKLYFYTYAADASDEYMRGKTVLCVAADGGATDIHKDRGKAVYLRPTRIEGIGERPQALPGSSARVHVPADAQASGSTGGRNGESVRTGADGSTVVDQTATTLLAASVLSSGAGEHTSGVCDTGSGTTGGGYDGSSTGGGYDGGSGGFDSGSGSGGFDSGSSGSFDSGSASGC